jgi:uncharacterized protein
MQHILRQPLTINELEQLHEFLSSPHDGASPMNLTECHGFLTAILSAPSLIMPSKWEPILLGGHPNFESIEQATNIIQLIGRFNNQISKELRESEYFEPVIFDNGSVVAYQKASLEMIAEWCDGYLKGSKLDPLWCSDEIGAASLFPFAVFARRVDLRGTKDTEGNIIEDDTLHKERIKKKLPSFIKDIFNRWLEHRKNPQILSGSEDNDDVYDFGSAKNESIRNLDKVGRNELCPCGSGKKYKKCCIETNRSVH